MIFTVQIEDKKFPILLKGKSDYIDVLVKNREVDFLVYDTGMMVGFRCPIITCEDYEEVFFRLPTKIFLGFLSDGLIEFTVTDMVVLFKFMEKKSSDHYLFEVKKQVVNFERFERLELIRAKLQSGCYTEVPLQDLGVFIRLAQYVGGIVSSDGSVYYCATHNIQLYQETTFDNSQSLSIYAKDLSMLYRYSDSVWNIENMVVAKFGDFLVAIDKVRQTMMSDYRFLAAKKSKKKFTANMSNALAAVKRLQHAVSDAEINFTQKQCKIATETCKLTVPIQVTGEKSDKAGMDLDSLLDSLATPQEDVAIFLNKMQSGLLYGIKQDMIFEIFRNFVKVALSQRMFLIISRSV